MAYNNAFRTVDQFRKGQLSKENLQQRCCGEEMFSCQKIRLRFVLEYLKIGQLTTTCIKRFKDGKKCTHLAIPYFFYP